ncbi:hypothetical protein AXK12_05575 [Cephaloticoccus capnophilus]|uniref:NadR/Ttd14 AAA domain-containing protein n=1 Tax=Cephaloticoccus capnophilus TaxID=1548208 RepID=A0A139SLA0_9BACT|nr:AAA family ATPase [Cephaloticoccus capnophilus]KXU35317.1 hypothetical protein AXK12_05575 [Cephaloticoccus capnophilus]
MQRADFQSNPLLRVSVVGTDSTGKSTLAQYLGQHYGAPVALEFVRAFWDAHAGQIVAEDLPEIGRGQMAKEDRAAAEALHRRSPLLITDTELLTNVLYADLLFPGHCPDWEREEAERRSRRYALYLLCDTDVPFVPDPQRGSADPKRRAMMRRLFREMLTSRGLPFVDICGDWAERECRAVEAIDRLLESSDRSL